VEEYLYDLLVTLQATPSVRCTLTRKIPGEPEHDSQAVAPS
jgi:hypothetical protein